MTKRVPKISIIGAGAVGATLAQRILESGMADLVLVDILKDIATAKAFDLLDAAPITGHERKIIATDDYEDIGSSGIVVITAGLARKPGMTREDLIAKNSAIVKQVSDEVKARAGDSIVIVVTNPLDSMSYLAYKTTGFKREKVFGMAGVLDASRFIQLVADDLKVPRASVQIDVMGSHGDTMVPVLSQARVGGKNLSALIPRDRLEALVKRTRDRGAELVKLFGSGSAYYSPSAAVFKMVRAILNDTEETMVVSAYLDGEYGLSDLYIGVPCKIGRSGIRKIVEIDLSEEENASLIRSAEAIKNSIKLLP